jgi:hypothetical protein
MADGEGLIRPAVMTSDLPRGARNSDHCVGRALDVLMQDVRQVRGDVNDLPKLGEQLPRRANRSAPGDAASADGNPADVGQELTAVRQEAASRHAEIMSAIRTLDSSSSSA